MNGSGDNRRLRLGRLESLAALAGGVTHELSNLAASVMMSVQLLEPCCKEAADRQVLASLDELARRLQHAGRQLHWLARGVGGEPTVFQAQYLLSDLQKLARAAFPSSIAVVTRYPPDLWPLAGDPLIVFQLLLALCLEARGHLTGAGTLVLAAANAELGGQAPAAGNSGVAGAGGVAGIGGVAGAGRVAGIGGGTGTSGGARGSAGATGAEAGARGRPGRWVVLAAIAEASADDHEATTALGAGADSCCGRAARLPQGSAILASRRRAVRDARRAAAAAGGFTAPLHRGSAGRGRRAYLPAATLADEPPFPAGGQR
jgi:hypothetical protein